MSNLRLSDQDRAMLHGEFGKGPEIAMRILSRIANIQGASELLDVSQVHIGGSIYTGPGSLEIIEKFVEYGAQVRVPSTLNAMSVDKQRWQQFHVAKEFATKAIRLADAFEKLGAAPTFSCAPYALPGAPAQGQDIVWAESNAITYANSLLGARTNRHGDFLDICAAITGRAPKTGLHLTENRWGKLLVEVPAQQSADDSFYTALGYLIGQQAGHLIPVIDGLRSEPSLEDLKALFAAASTSGAVGLVHIVGVTPEAPTRDAAFGGRTPQRCLRVTHAMLEEVKTSLTTGAGAPALDLVVLGSPHFTLGDFQELARLLADQPARAKVPVWIMTSRYVLEQAQAAGWAQEAERFGARISTDTCLCMLNTAILPPGTKTIMTSSGKFAHYGPGLVNRPVWYSSLKNCISSAVTGTPITRSSA